MILRWLAVALETLQRNEPANVDQEEEAPNAAWVSYRATTPSYDGTK